MLITAENHVIDFGIDLETFKSLIMEPYKFSFLLFNKMKKNVSSPQKLAKNRVKMVIIGYFFPKNPSPQKNLGNFCRPPPRPSLIRTKLES